MKKLLLFSLTMLAAASLTFGQDTLLNFETVKDPLIEPFDLVFPTNETTEFYVANPDGDGSVGKITKNECCFWGGINVFFGGDIVFSGTNDKFTVDFYAPTAGTGDSILFKFQLFNRYPGGPGTIEVDAYYSDANDKQVGVWKTLEFPIPDGTTGAYNQMVIFFGWNYVAGGDVFYYDNVVAPGFSAYGNTEVTFNITDKFNNATDVKLFVDGTEKTLTQAANVYSATESLPAYTVLGGLSNGQYEAVYSYMANGAEKRDTATFLAGSADGTQEVKHLIIVEAEEDGTAIAYSVGTTPPTIDGTIDDVWNNAPTHTNQQRTWWSTTPTGMYSTWKVMWDIDNVYLLYTVEDETPNGGNAVDLWKNDCIETFFDMNQSAKDGYDADDWQIRTVRGNDTWSGSANVTGAWAADVERAQAAMADDKGYIVELAIPWLSLSSTFLPLAGKEFNFDNGIADVTDEGGTRIFRESWTTDEDNAYLNTSKFGTITLSSETSGPTSVTDIKETSVSVYPNPVSGQLFISSEESIATYSIHDITGRILRSANYLNDNNVSLNLSDMNDGIYLLKVTDRNGNASVQKIQVKK